MMVGRYFLPGRVEDTRNVMKGVKHDAQVEEVHRRRNGGVVLKQQLQRALCNISN
jgi:hypothetical protein